MLRADVGRRKPVLRVLISIMLVLTCAGGTACAQSSKGNQTTDGKVIVRVSMYNSSSFPEWRAYVEQQCPDVYIQWDNNRNACSNVLYEAEHGDMPDIVCIRKFESDSARQLEPYLADLSDTELASTFKQDALTPFQDDGRQYWLPEPGAVEGLYANVDILNQYGLALPTDMKSFIDTCRTLRENGVTPFATDCTAGYTNVALIEGFGSACCLRSDEGIAYRQDFDDGGTDQVDLSNTTRIFDVLRTLKDEGILTDSCFTESPDAISSAFLNGKVAIGKRTSDQINDVDSKYTFAALPYFGETPDDSCLFTYPVFSVALSGKSMRDEQRAAACTEVMEAMMSADAQTELSGNTSGLVSYTSGVTLPLQKSMESVRPLIEQDRYYIRSMNSNSFSATTNAMRALIVDDADDETIISGLNSDLFNVKEPVQVGKSDVEAVITLDDNLCSPAGSVIAQSVRNQTDTDIAIIDSREAASNIYKGSYTDVDVAAVVLDGNVFTGNLTGSEVTQLMRNCIIYSTTFGSGMTEPYLDYPALAGMTVTMEKSGAIDGIVMSDGAELDDGACYRVTVSARVYNAMKANGNVLTDRFTKQDMTLSRCLSGDLASDAGLSSASEYYVVR